MKYLITNKYDTCLYRGGGGGLTKESGLKLQRACEIHYVDIWGTAEVKTNVCLLSIERYIFLCRSTYLFLRHWFILNTWGYIRKI